MQTAASSGLIRAQRVEATHRVSGRLHRVWLPGDLEEASETGEDQKVECSHNFQTRPEEKDYSILFA